MSYKQRYGRLILVGLVLLSVFALQRVSSTINGLYPISGYYYQSRLRVMDMPVVDVRLPPQKVPEGLKFAEELEYCRARGVFAAGPIAVGVVSVGIASAGVIAFGVASVGVIGFGVASLALFASFGVLALSTWRAYAVQPIAPYATRPRARKEQA